MKDSVKAIWMRRRDGMEEDFEDDRLDLLPDEPTRALWSACPNPPPLDMSEANDLFRRALEQSGVKPRWWFMPRPAALTFATCGGVFMAAFLAFGPSNGPSAWLPLIQSLAPRQEMARSLVRPANPAPFAAAPLKRQPATVAGTGTVKRVAAKSTATPPVRLAAAEPVEQARPARTSSSRAPSTSPKVAVPRTKPAPTRLALAAPPMPAQRSHLYVTVSRPEPMVTASITHDDSARGGYAKVTALRPYENGVLVRTEATVTSSEPDPQVVTHLPSWATGSNGLPAPMSTRTVVTGPATEGDK